MSSLQITFDVGGKKYKVLASLLNKHPNSLLTKQAVRIGRRIFSEIQIDCNAERFQYVLDYMKRKEEDDPIYIPTTVSKNALIKEIKHCGFDNVKPWQIVVEGKDSTTLEYLQEMEAELETMLEEIRTCGRDYLTLEYLQESEAELETMIEKIRTCQIAVQWRDSPTPFWFQETEAEFETMLQETEAEFETMLERIRFRKRKLLGIN